MLLSSSATFVLKSKFCFAKLYITLWPHCTLPGYSRGSVASYFSTGQGNQQDALQLGQRSNCTSSRQRVQLQQPFQKGLVNCMSYPKGEFRVGISFTIFAVGSVSPKFRKVDETTVGIFFAYLGIGSKLTALGFSTKTLNCLLL